MDTALWPTDQELVDIFKGFERPHKDYEFGKRRLGGHEKDVLAQVV